MKALIAAASTAALLTVAPVVAQAQPMGSNMYGSIGYAQANTEGADLGAIQGRIGARFGPNFGIEGELAGGVKDDTISVGGVPVDVELEHQAAFYGVGFLPVAPNIDLLARVGYGTTGIEASTGGVSASADGDSWNLGVGGQWFMDDRNGFRADYTRYEFGDDEGDADVWSVAYVRRF